MKLAFVIPWYGEDIPGGAEFATRRLAEELAARGRPVGVLTTCIRDFHSDWGRNFHQPGARIENGVLVRRFKVVRRNAPVFNDLNARLLHGQSLRREEEITFLREMVNSPDLIRHIADQGDGCRCVFVPYLFSTSYYGVKVSQGQAWLMPCLHEESYAHLWAMKEMFESAHGVIYLSQPEMDLARHLYNLEHATAAVVGVGVSDAGLGDAQRFVARSGIADPFILYIGRRDATKNVPMLIDCFRHYRRLRRNELKLVLMGGGDRAADADGVIDLGYVSAQDKADALAAAHALCQPSIHESFSIVIMEAWLAGTPVLVHAECAVTVDHCRRSNGGLYFQDAAEFAACLDFLLSQPETARRMGELGRRYVRVNFNWDAVIRRFDYVLQS